MMSTARCKAESSTDVIGCVQKGSTGLIKVALSVYAGRHLVDVREYFHADNGEVLPTKKGVNLSVEHLDELIAQLQRAREKAAEAGWLPQREGSRPQNLKAVA